ncbi:hypothetical protein ACLOJK_013274 [Asimina triloba]
MILSESDINMAITVVSKSNPSIFCHSQKPTSAEKPPQPPTAGYIVSPRKLLKLETAGCGGARINAWLDAMKASSPTAVRSTASFPSMSAAVAQDQSSWILHHPSALSMFEEITNASKGKQIVMFLDYDGTLSPIVEDPDRAFMSEAMRKAVKNLARCFPTAIVSGRCRDKVYNFVRLAELYYAGSHGMDITGPIRSPKYKKIKSGIDKQANQTSYTWHASHAVFIIGHSRPGFQYRYRASTTQKRRWLASKAVVFQPASEFLPMIDEVYKTLVEKTKSTPGAIVENNKFCVSVHYRCVDEKRWSALADQVKEVLKEYPKLRLTQGRKVLEIRPTIKWDKGKALEFLLESLGLADCSDVLPVYIGDDRTDEDAFKVLRERGQGFGILVSKIPKDTNATYTLQEPAEVKDFLHRLVEWKRLSMQGRSRV